MKPAFRRTIIAVSIALALPIRGHAFADNVVRADRFKWMKVATDHFDIYYDKKAERMVPRMAQYLEKAWQEVGDKTGFHVPTRTPFFLYSDHNLFEQSNIVHIDEGTGGVTEAFKNRLLIYNDGSNEWLAHVIPHEFTHVTQFNILYTGLFRSVQLFIKSPFYPLWWMEGMAEWGAGSIDEWESDFVIRDAVASHTLPDLQELHGFAHLKPNQVTLGYKTGEAAMDFLVDEYGQDKVLALVIAMRDHFDISTALSQVIAGNPNGFDLDRFNFRFREWITDKYAADIAACKRPADYGTQLTGSDGIPVANAAPAISKDGKTVYYMSDVSGPLRVFELNLATKKSRPLFSLDWTEFENLHPEGRGVSVSADGRTLAFSGEKGQRDFLYLYDLQRHKLKRVKIPFDELRSPIFSPTDNDRLVCVGLDNGYTDLYLIDKKGQVKRRLTDTPQHEEGPAFSPDGKKVYFSGEMMSADGVEPVGRDIFAYDLETSSLTQVTSLLGRETDPEVLPDGSVVFSRSVDDTGHKGSELFRLKPGSGTAEQLTRVPGGIFSPRYSPAVGKLFYVGFNAGERQLYEGNWDFSVASSTPVVAKPDELEPLEGPRIAPPTIASTEWPKPGDSPLLRSPARPYRFQGSTDLFLPFFLYSTDSGFAAVALWQYSDMLGNHTLQEQAQFATGTDFYDVSSFYTYARFRPSITVGGTAQRYYEDFDEVEQRQEAEGVLIVSYPLSRVNSVLAGVGARSQKDLFIDDSGVNDDVQDRYYSVGLSYDTVTGRYLIPVRGQRLSVVFQQGGRSVGGNQSYRSGEVEAVQYAPLPRESTFVSRLFYGRSVGENPQVFRLGGVDRIRGFSDTDSNDKQNAVFASEEIRFRLSYLNARTKFLFPDFFFKAAYLIAFDDVGYGWDTPAERDAFQPRYLYNSAGAGISWPTFILQTFKLDLTVLWAKQTASGRETWYVTIGPAF